MKINRTGIEVVRASVLEQDVDAIVNAANTGMRGGGALDGAIHRAAGRAMLGELTQLAPNGATTAEVVVTLGHDLPQKFIFHVAGPVWKPGREDECDEMLARSYRNCLQEADIRGLESLAFPSLSTGVYSFPLDRAAPIAIGTAVEFLRANAETSLKKVVFAMFGGEEHYYFVRALRKYESES